VSANVSFFFFSNKFSQSIRGSDAVVRVVRLAKTATATSLRLGTGSLALCHTMNTGPIRNRRGLGVLPP
jgi:hypothetical protein